jgi:hypothetical protein
MWQLQDSSVNTGGVLHSYLLLWYRCQKEQGVMNISAVWDFKFSRRRVWCSELSSGLYCRVKWLSIDVSEVHTHPWWWRQYVPLKRRSTIILHGSTTQKTALNIISAVCPCNCQSSWAVSHYDTPPFQFCKKIHLGFGVCTSWCSSAFTLLL